MANTFFKQFMPNCYDIKYSPIDPSYYAGYSASRVIILRFWVMLNMVIIIGVDLQDESRRRISNNNNVLGFGSLSHR
jgi:hypothetical protein